jgi:hypothetical protein
VLVSLVIEATKPDRVPDMETERRTAAATPVAMARGAKRTRLALAAGAMWFDMMWLRVWVEGGWVSPRGEDR